MIYHSEAIQLINKVVAHFYLGKKDFLMTEKEQQQLLAPLLGIIHGDEELKRAQGVSQRVLEIMFYSRHLSFSSFKDNDQISQFQKIAIAREHAILKPFFQLLMQYDLLQKNVELEKVYQKTSEASLLMEDFEKNINLTLRIGRYPLTNTRLYSNEPQYPSMQGLSAQKFLGQVLSCMEKTFKFSLKR